MKRYLIVLYMLIVQFVVAYDAMAAFFDLGDLQLVAYNNEAHDSTGYEVHFDLGVGRDTTDSYQNLNTGITLSDFGETSWSDIKVGIFGGMYDVDYNSVNGLFGSDTADFALQNPYAGFDGAILFNSNTDMLPGTAAKKVLAKASGPYWNWMQGQTTAGIYGGLLVNPATSYGAEAVLNGGILGGYYLYEYDYHNGNRVPTLLGTFVLDTTSGSLVVGYSEGGISDTDGDGVNDDVDECPDTPSGAVVDETGCTIAIEDADGDGVSDGQDQCPNTPAGADVDETGCTIAIEDEDGDGVPDDEDQCPDTPEDVEVNENGCPDADGDGVSDDQDQCPDTPAGTAVDENGCPLESDADGDGVLDDVDECAGTPLGTTVNDQGCPDSDGDGVSDDADGCPNDRNKTEPGECGCGVEEGTCDDPPLNAPTLKSPADKAVVKTRFPELIVNNITGLGDEVYYVFEVYKDKNLNLRIVNSSISEGNGEATGWDLWHEEAQELLQEEKTYYWRAKATNGNETTEWMETASFFVDAVNSAPAAPTASAPLDGASVSTVNPDIVVVNSVDEAGDTRTYDFELYADEAMMNLTANEFDVPEATSGSTTAWHTSGEDIVWDNNTRYWWRAKAKDNGGAVSPWSDLYSFLLDVTDNEPPTAPTISGPKEGEMVRPGEVVLEINNATDPEGRTLTYLFELDTAASFDGEEKVVSGLVSEGSNGKTTWDPKTKITLEDQTMYYWRAIAFDGAFYGTEWAMDSFFTSTNMYAPEAPGLFSPYSGEVVKTLTPELTVTNATDADEGAELTYTFQVFKGNETEPVIEETAVAEGSKTTSITPTVDLEDGKTYRWRVKANDGMKDSEWMPGIFTIDTKSITLDVEIIQTKIIRKNESTSKVIKITDYASSLYGMEMTVPKGALDEDMSFCIGIAGSPPDLPKGYKFTDDPNEVIVLGPSGITFNKTIQVKIPYSIRNSSDKVVLFSKDDNGGSWETLPVKEITDDYLIFETDHFSLFAVAEKESGGGSGSGSGGGGGGCFIGAVLGGIFEPNFEP
ncbi:MAG: thrombospondin type 3 repeat-containing protein [Pseudomonadota bacterium]